MQLTFGGLIAILILFDLHWYYTVLTLKIRTSYWGIFDMSIAPIYDAYMGILNGSIAYVWLILVFIRGYRLDVFEGIYRNVLSNYLMANNYAANVILFAIQTPHIYLQTHQICILCMNTNLNQTHVMSNIIILPLNHEIYHIHLNFLCYNHAKHSPNTTT